ncbi:MAG: NAD(P)-binding domain-containing protein, partial [bacterium]|nr:NAD(P)-binding domain-containing protein [bacterium]
MANRYYEKDGNLATLQGRKIAIVGYGSQGHAHALNLRDSGVDVIVSDLPGSDNWKKAEAAGLPVMTTPAAAAQGDVIMILVADHVQGPIYESDIGCRGSMEQFNGGHAAPYLQKWEWDGPPAGDD